jgi:hypothetical protein
MDIPLEHLNHEAPSVSETFHEQQTSESQPAKISEISESSDPITHVEDSADEAGENMETESNKKNESKSKHTLSDSGHAGSAAPIGPGEGTSIVSREGTSFASRASTSIVSREGTSMTSRDDTPTVMGALGGFIPITGANNSPAPSCGTECADCCADCCVVSCDCLCLSIACCYDTFWAVVCCPIRMPLMCCLLCWEV